VFDLVGRASHEPVHRVWRLSGASGLLR